MVPMMGLFLPVPSPKLIRSFCIFIFLLYQIHLKYFIGFLHLGLKTKSVSLYKLGYYFVIFNWSSYLIAWKLGVYFFGALRFSEIEFHFIFFSVVDVWFWVKFDLMGALSELLVILFIGALEGILNISWWTSFHLF